MTHPRANEHIRIVPLNVSWWRKLLAKLPGFCSHCGHKYISGYRGGAIEQMGRCCPNGHEGYVN